MSIVPGVPVVRLSSTGSITQHAGITDITALAAPATADQSASIAVFARPNPPSQSQSHHLHDSSQPIHDIEDLIASDGAQRRLPPVVPALCPYRVQLTVGEHYRWCSCGRSAEQPFCDETCDEHSDDFRPLRFTVNNQQRFWHLCGCKYTAMPPWCDGSHIHAIQGYEETKNSTSNKSKD